MGMIRVTPKILFNFFKLFEGGYLKFSSEELSLSKYFLLCQVFCFGFTQDLVLGLGGFPFLFGVKTQCFSLGKISFENLLNSPRAFWVIFSPSQNSSCHDLSGNPLPKTFPSSLDHVLHQIQQVEPPHVIISIYILFK